MLAVLLFVSCGKGNSDGTLPPIPETTDVPISDTFATDEPILPAEPQIELVTHTENIASAAGSTKTFIYPKVSIPESAELTDRINREIEAACNNLFKRTVPGAASMVNGGSEIVYKTTDCNTYIHNGRYLFIEFYVTVDVFGAVADEMPSKAYSAVCIDMSNGVPLYSERIVKDLDKLKDALLNREFTLAEGTELTDNDISEALIQYRVDYGIYPPVYFDGKRVTVCVELAKLQGGYALFHIPADKAINYFADEIIT